MFSNRFIHTATLLLVANTPLVFTNSAFGAIQVISNDIEMYALAYHDPNDTSGSGPLVPIEEAFNTSIIDSGFQNYSNTIDEYADLNPQYGGTYGVYNGFADTNVTSNEASIYFDADLSVTVGGYRTSYSDAGVSFNSVFMVDKAGLYNVLSNYDPSGYSDFFTHEFLITRNDNVVISQNIFGSDLVYLNAGTYTFSADVSLNSFYEGQQNAMFFASIQDVNAPSPVPLPGAAFLMLSAFGCLGVRRAFMRAGNIRNK